MCLSYHHVFVMLSFVCYIILCLLYYHVFVMLSSNQPMLVNKRKTDQSKPDKPKLDLSSAPACLTLHGCISCTLYQTP